LGGSDGETTHSVGWITVIKLSSDNITRDDWKLMMTVASCQILQGN